MRDSARHAGGMTAPHTGSTRQIQLVQVTLRDGMVGTARDPVDARCDRAAPLSVLGQRFYQRSHELTPALRGQETLHRRHSGVVSVAYREIEPGEQDFIVSRLVEFQAVVEMSLILLVEEEVLGLIL